MYKFVAVFALAIICVSADPKPKPGGLIAAPAAVVTATSSQSFIRNAAAAPLVAAPAFAAPYAPYFASPYVASPYLASPYAAPIIAF